MVRHDYIFVEEDAFLIINKILMKHGWDFVGVSEEDMYYNLLPMEDEKECSPFEYFYLYKTVVRTTKNTNAVMLCLAFQAPGSFSKGLVEMRELEEIQTFLQEATKMNVILQHVIDKLKELGQDFKA